MGIRLWGGLSIWMAFVGTSRLRRAHGLSERLVLQRSLVVNGQAAVRGRYPYFVALDHYGAGVLIAPDIVLTAGHCRPTHMHDVKPRLAAYEYKDDDDPERKESTTTSSSSTRFSIVEMVRHPDFERLGDDEFRNDFTLLKLNQPSMDIPPVSLNRNPRVPHTGQGVIVMGLGVTSRDPGNTTRPDVLQEARLTAISNEVCSHAAGRKKSYDGRIVDTHLCTRGGPENLRDSCSYDSGGPLVIPGKSAKDDVVVALVSWGMRCGDPDFPGVNARVSEVSHWLDATVCAMSDDPPADFCPPLDRSNDVMHNALIVLVLMTAGGLLLKRRRRRSKTQSSPEDWESDESSLLADKAVCRSDSTASSEYDSIEVMESSATFHEPA